MVARLFAPFLDDALAMGLDPTRSVLRRVRAQQLVSPPLRRGLAERWLALLDEARTPPSRFDPAIPIRRVSLERAEGQVRGLSSALRRPVVRMRGVAMATALLRDGSGPLYSNDAETNLASAIDEVIREIDPLARSGGR